MNLNNNEKKHSCPPSALFRPSLFRMAFLPFNLIACWAAVFFKARASETLPWTGLILATIFVGGVFVVEALISSRFSGFLVPALFGFLAGAGVNVIVQSLLGRFQGLNWTFQSPMLFSLGTVLFGFMGSLIFIFYGHGVREVFTFPTHQKGQIGDKFQRRTFIIIIWLVTILMTLALCVSLAVILKEFAELESPNPFRKPLWFSGAAILLVFLLVIWARKNLLRLGLILLPGIILGLIWASVIRDIWEGFYLAYPRFPLAPEALEFILVINFCFLGIAWLNKAAYDSK